MARTTTHRFASGRSAQALPGTTHGYWIRWGDLTLHGEGFPSRDEMETARAAMFDELEKDGWTQPKWWQFWRRADTRR